MRLESKIQWKVKGKMFGGPKLMECIPVISKNEEELLRDVEEIASHSPDVIEWRIDYYDQLDHQEHIVSALNAIQPMVEEIPILLTFRHISEGGYKEESQETRLRVIEAACGTGQISMVDVEQANEPEFLDAVKAIVKKHGVKLVLSAHDFKNTPSEQEIVDSIKRSRELGADVAKLAVMPRAFTDVLTLAKATYRARTQEVDIPLITVSMGEMGSITRVLGGEFGSDLSFLCSSGASGPGQIDIEEFREMAKLLSR